ncbi:MAG: winged helix-turn-helix transcriptional regulator [Promethearchaeota archaeon]
MSPKKKYKLKDRFKISILNTIQESQRGTTPTELSDLLDISRPTAKKYVEALRRDGLIEVHDVGPYTICFAKKRGENVIFERVYFFLLKLMNDLGYLDDVKSKYILNNFKIFTRENISDFKLPVPENINDISNMEEGLDQLKSLINLIKNLLYFLIPRGTIPEISMVPTLGKLKPMSVLLRVDDPGYILMGASFHYEIVAPIVEEYLSYLLKRRIVFKIAKPIDKRFKNVYYELGYVDNYYQLIFVKILNDISLTEEDVLKEIQKFYSSMASIDVENYKRNNKLYYYIKFNNNRDVEAMFTMAIESLKENIEIAKNVMKQTKHKLLRKWEPFEKWGDSPFLTISIETNLGTLLDDYVKLSEDYYKFGAICTHFEKQTNGWMMYFKEKLDFDMLFTPLDDFEKRYKIYSQITDDPKAFFVKRVKALKKRAEILKLRRVENRGEDNE